ncbi:MAG: isoaspartyl peptidase/L-asparaginase [Ignavibacteria bacterium]|nr:isoaspartyl peptidase/L-asparaginase [Ignavibacteria bacterium]MBK7184407.1 isoaspartyl peptidase/L-asparaginase [Ignavibacteria bacterium]
MPNPIALAIHGGAGNLARYAGTGRLEQAEEMLRCLIQDLHQQLKGGSPAIEIATQAVIAMEDSGLFHAGKGSSPNSKGFVELDASIMHGRHRTAGSIAAATSIKNPIITARYVMEQTEQVLIVGSEADLLAELSGSEIVGPDYFVPCDEIGAALPSMGTVGAVVLDARGDIVAATSTGGTLRKRAGRVGDAPIIGAGTYAVNNIGGISCTGVGEYFLRVSAASRAIARMDLLGESAGAASGSILSEITELGGSGGMIVIDQRGTVSMPFSTSGMYRASVDATGRVVVGCL